MPQIRKHAHLGDIIIGMAGSAKNGLGRIHPAVIYWMRVCEALTFDQYWNDPRFARKAPQIPGPKSRMVGDRSYRHEGDQLTWRFSHSMHYLPHANQVAGGHAPRDTRVDRLLVGKEYTYWGASGPAVLPHLMELFPNPRGQRCPAEGELLDELHRLVDIENPKGLVGEPADWGNPRYFKS
jgi:hypothetical protein